MSMAGAAAPETMRKALAMGAASGGARDRRRARRIRHAARRRVSSRRRSGASSTTCCSPGADTSDGGAGVVPAGVATLLGLPYLSYAAKIEPDPAAGRVRVHRISPTGYDVLEAPMPALVVATQALGEPRYPSLKGIMAARSKTVETRDLAGRRPATGRSAARSRRRASSAAEAPPPRAATRVVREPAAASRARGRRVPRRAEDHLMAGAIWVHGETAPDGSLAKISTEVATLARTLGAAAGRDVVGIVVAADPAAAAAELAGYVPRVARGHRARRRADHAAGHDRRPAARRADRARPALRSCSPEPDPRAATSPASSRRSRAGASSSTRPRSSGTTDRSSR